LLKPENAEHGVLNVLRALEFVQDGSNEGTSVAALRIFVLNLTEIFSKALGCDVTK